MRSMQDAGLEDVRRLRQRCLRIRAMGRIGEEDCDYIVERCDEIEARVINMFEIDPSRKEF